MPQPAPRRSPIQATRVGRRTRRRRNIEKLVRSAYRDFPLFGASPCQRPRIAPEFSSWGWRLPSSFTRPRPHATPCPTTADSGRKRTFWPTSHYSPDLKSNHRHIGREQCHAQVRNALGNDRLHKDHSRVRLRVRRQPRISSEALRFSPNLVLPVQFEVMISLARRFSKDPEKRTFLYSRIRMIV